MMNSFLKTGFTSALFFICGFAVAAKSPLTPYNKANSQIAETRIVGGEEAIQENWPWMTAYVFTFNELVTSLSVNDVNYETRSFTSGVGGQASGEIMTCGIGDAVCTDAIDKVCLIERGEVNFSEKANNCEAGGGIGAIIYNNEEAGNISGTLGDEYTGTIPIVAVNQKDGLALLEQIGSIASLAVSETTELQQDSSCGASFLGDKWVLTAAHCVDDGNPSGFKMNVGEYDLADGAENAIDIANIFIHPLYEAGEFDNDIALVELVSSVDAPAVQIAEPEVTDQYATENSLATVAGWGGRLGYAPGDGPTADFPDILHKVDLQLMTNEQCQDTLNSDGSLVTANMLCAAIPEGGKGSCQGDSGGPLVINTGSGVQQVGIVSWGIGCAAQDYPGVYTRVSQYKQWMSAITEGVAVTQRHDFGLGIEGEVQTTELTVTNNSEINVGLDFELSGSSDFTLDASNCATLDAASSCQLSINYLPASANDVTAELTITADDNQVQTSGAIVTGTTLISAVELSAIVGSASDAVSLFSGGFNGASGWTANTEPGGEGIESGTTGDVQDSIFIAQIVGEGVLTFDWSVSSEENTDLVETDPEFEPYDALYLYVNDILIDYISGEVAFTEFSVDLAEGTNVINWTYNKDLNAADGLDKGFIRNLVFTPVVVAPPVVRPPVTSNSSGGGSLSWMLLCLLGLTFRLRNKV
jgi:secreted trypsin-like serine protease